MLCVAGKDVFFLLSLFVVVTFFFFILSHRFYPHVGFLSFYAFFFFFLFFLSVGGFANTYTVDGAKDVKDGLSLFFFFDGSSSRCARKKVLIDHFLFFFYSPVDGSLNGPSCIHSFVRNAQSWSLH